MTIYTKTGDTGATSLFGGKRVLKSDFQVEAYGTVDELSSFLGFVHAKSDSKKDRELIIKIQKDLHQIMAFLAGDKRINLSKLNKQIKLFEKEIDSLEKNLPKLNSFILPQGGEIAALFHISRTVCRRAERSIVRYFSKKLRITNYELRITSYLNRLSDFLFMLARKYTKGENKVKYH